MRKLHRRVEALEKLWRAKLDVRQGIAKNAVGFWSKENEQLISAYGAARVGRPLTEPEAMAFEDYTKNMEGQYRFAGINPIRCDHASDIDPHAIRKAMLNVVTSRIPLEQLKLVESGSRAAQIGREPNEQESAAIAAWDSEWNRLLELAGVVP
jgi:hypothetical protein